MFILKNRIVVFILPILVFCVSVSAALSQPPAGAYAPADSYVGEELEYRIGFWLFEDVATGKVRLERGENGEYVATLRAYTTGFVDRVLRHRADTYTSHMVLSPDGKRFITVRFEKTVETTGKTKKSLTAFDYSKGLMTWRSSETGKDDRTGTENIPEGVWPADPLAGFYNFRSGIYGPVVRGCEYNIPTFPKDGKARDIYMRINTKEEAGQRINDRPFEADYLADVKIDKELFGSQSGKVEIIFSPEMIPSSAVAKDIFFFGDVRGRLVKAAFAVEFKKTAPAVR